MRDRDGGEWGDFRCPEPDTCRHRPWPARMVCARHGRPGGRHRRAPPEAVPEAVPVCKRRDPLLPLTGISGTARGAPATGNETARPSSRGQPGGQSVGMWIRRPARSRRARCWERTRRFRHAFPAPASPQPPVLSDFRRLWPITLHTHPCSHGRLRSTTGQGCQW